MKKAKIMLTAITVLAVVGGALAFKANTNSGVTLYYSTNGDIDQCLVSIDVTSAPLFDQQPTIATPNNDAVWYTTKVGSECESATPAYSNPN